MIDLDEYRVRKSTVSAALFRAADDALEIITICVRMLHEAKAHQPNFLPGERERGETYIRTLIGGAKMTDNVIDTQLNFMPYLNQTPKAVSQRGLINHKRERLYHGGYAHVPITTHQKGKGVAYLQDIVQDAGYLQDKINCFLEHRNAPLLEKSLSLKAMWDRRHFSDQDFSQRLPIGSVELYNRLFHPRGPVKQNFDKEREQILELIDTVGRAQKGMERFVAACKDFSPLPPGV